MKIKIYLLVSIYLVISNVGCSNDKYEKQLNPSVILKTSNKEIQTKFENCLLMTQQLIKNKITEKEFSKYFFLNKSATGFEYDNVVWSISDTLTEQPKNYKIFYDFIYKGDTLSTFRADFDSNLKLIDYRNYHLIAFRKFIDKELTITKSIAEEIALKNGMKSEGLELILNCSSNKFYWRCTNNCDDCLYLEIDAKNGKIIGQGKVVIYN